MHDLDSALESNRDAISKALPEAERDLSECRARCAQLEESIARARLVLEGTSRAHVAAPTLAALSLKQAIVIVLGEHPDGLRAPEIAQIIEERGLYRRRDGKAAGYGQVHNRVHQNPGLFRRESGRIFLQDSDGKP